MAVQPIQLTSIDAVAMAPADSCGCEGGSCAVGSVSAAPASGEREILVDGMTCEHCVRAVTDELDALDGIEDVSIELVVGGPSRVVLHTSAPVSDGDVRGAVEEAGYRLA